MGDYKTAKEAFVAGNPGQSVWEVNAVSLVGLVSLSLRNGLQNIAHANRHHTVYT